MRPILALNCLLQTEQERSEEESSVGDALALAFRCARFCSASLILFASYSPAPLLMRPCHCSILCNLFPRLCWYVEIFNGGFEGVLVSLLLTTMGAFSYLKFSMRIFFCKRSSDILVAWSVHLNCANFRRVCTLCIPALFRTSVSGSCLAT